MCGIAAIAIGKKRRDQIPYPRFQELITQLLVGLEIRGRHATGIAVINTGTDYPSVAFKKPIRASRLIERPRYKDALENVGPDTDFVLLHTRLATTGDNRILENNHPILIPGFIGIHNGSITNAEDLFKQYKDECQRSGEVDSEIIFRLFRMFAERGENPINALKDTTRLLEGAFTGAVIDWLSPGKMLLFKYGRPLAIIKVPFYDLVIFISLESIFYSAVKKLGMKLKCKASYALDGTGFLVDLISERKVVNNIMEFQLPIEKSTKLLTTHTEYLSSISNLN